MLKSCDDLPAPHLPPDAPARHARGRRYLPAVTRSTLTPARPLALAAFLLALVVGFGESPTALAQQTATDLAYAPWQRAITDPLPARQVHLDFHTSEAIPDIGKRWDKAKWQAALKAGNVNHINIFSKGHHGWAYYPTEKGKMHPNLDFDLLGAQLEACHEIGVKAPCYFTVGWSERDTREHPEWAIRDKDGSINAPGYDRSAGPDAERPTYLWERLDPSPGLGYHEDIMAQVEELCVNYPDLDGFWFDIYHVARANYNDHARARMKREGVDINDTLAVQRSHSLAVMEHMRQLRELVARHHPEATVYFNATTRLEDVSLFKERVFEMDTHQDLEDLPTTWGGYNKLPLDAKFHLQQGVPIVGMSGKFHKAWGEFGGFKHPDAIKYEAAAMISFGASCNFGDQLHPSGEMDIETYRNIGYAYDYVEQIEDYGPGGVPVAKLGVMLTLDNAADHGVANMLLETQTDFLVATPDNLDQFEVVIVPSGAGPGKGGDSPASGDVRGDYARAGLSPKQAAALQAYAAGGGKVIAFGAGALNTAGDAFALDVGAEYVGPSEYQFDYTVVRPTAGGLQVRKAGEVNGLVSTPFVNYDGGYRARMTSGGEALAMIREPYFDRTYAKFNGHRETPYKLEDSAYPAVLRKGNVTWVAHDLDKLYFEHGVRMHRDLVEQVIGMLHDEPMVEVEGLPSAGRVSLLHQPQHRRYVAHLLYAPPLGRGDVEVIEDLPTVSGVTVAVDVPEAVKSVRLIPGEREVAFERRDGAVHVAVPPFSMHTGVVLGY